MEKPEGKELEKEQHLTLDDFKATTESIASVYLGYLKGDNIVLTPDYQRDFCWSFEQSVYFLESVLYCPVIPSFVFSKYDREESIVHNCLYECIDGQHRLTVLKWFIEGTRFKTNGEYLYIKDRREGNFTRYLYGDIPEDIYTPKKCRYETLGKFERDGFNTVPLFIQTITKKLNFNTKSSIFKRLQNGSRVGTNDKFKNLDHVITNYLREHSIMNKKYKCDVLNEWYKLLDLQKNKKRSKDNFTGKIACILTRLIFIEDRGLDVNYMDLNIAKYIENKLPTAELTGKFSVEELYKKVVRRRLNIENLVPSMIGKKIDTEEKIRFKGGKIIEEFYYLLSVLDLSKHKDLDKNLINKKILDKYCEPENYLSYKSIIMDKKIKAKIVSKEMMMKLFNELNIDLLILEGVFIKDVEDAKEFITEDFYYLLYSLILSNPEKEYVHLKEALSDKEFLSQYCDEALYVKRKSINKTGVGIVYEYSTLSTEKFEELKIKLHNDLINYKSRDKKIIYEIYKEYVESVESVEGENSEDSDEYEHDFEEI